MPAKFMPILGVDGKIHIGDAQQHLEVGMWVTRTDCGVQGIRGILSETELLQYDPNRVCWKCFEEVDEDE